MSTIALAQPPGPDAQFRALVAAAEALTERGEAAEAERLLRIAVRVRPGSAAARNALGMALFDLGRMEEALACFVRLTELEAGASAAWANVGMVLKTLGRFDDAVVAHDHAVALDPRAAQPRLNRAVALLRAGRMTEAWEDYECRHAVSGGVAPARLLPVLQGDGTDLNGRTVLVTHEEGFGDTLQFIRYARLLANRGAVVLARVPGSLARIVERVAGVSCVVGERDIPPPHDYACPCFSLPRAFTTTLATIPSTVPYLHADPERVAHWAAALPGRSAGRLRVGLVWAGQARPWMPGFAAVDGRRSAGAAVFSRLAGVAADFVSLQLGATALPPGLELHDPMEAVSDFADTAALIANLDVVVSVDTAVAHLAGGMGKPILLLDRYDSCWRWLSGRTDSPWYPTLTIYRQPRPGAWHDAIDAARAALAAMALSAAAALSPVPAALPPEVLCRPMR